MNLSWKITSWKADGKRSRLEVYAVEILIEEKFSGKRFPKCMKVMSNES